jgi:hypothetical protein
MEMGPLKSGDSLAKPAPIFAKFACSSGDSRSYKRLTFMCWRRAEVEDVSLRGCVIVGVYVFMDKNRKRIWRVRKELNALLLKSFPSVMTSPGLSAKNVIPSSLNSTAYLTISKLAADLEIVYDTALVNPAGSNNSVSARPDEMTTTFLILDFLIRGRNALMLNSTPATFVVMEVCSSERNKASLPTYSLGVRN